MGVSCRSSATHLHRYVDYFHGASNYFQSKRRFTEVKQLFNVFARHALYISEFLGLHIFFFFLRPHKTHWCLSSNVHAEVYSLHKFLATKTLKRPSSSSSYTAAGVDCSGDGRVRVLDGRAVAAAWQEELAVEAADIRIRGGRPPGLGVILVGDRPDSQLYVARKQEACERAGVHADVRRLPATISQISLRRSLKALCSDPNIDGILVQLPLPPHIDEEDIIEHIDPQKDVDGFHPLNVG